MLIKITTSIIASLLICASGLAQNQGLSDKLSSLVDSAPIIIEGKVDSDKSSRYDAKGKIVTDHYIHVIKTIKGTVDDELVKVVVQGGRVGNWIQGSSHPVTLAPDDQGVFFLTQNNTDDANAYRIHGGNSGKITRLNGQSQHDAIHHGTLDTYRSWRKLKEAIYAEVGYGEDVKSITLNEFSRLTNDIELCVKLDNPTPNYVDNTVDFDILAKSSVAGIKFAKAEITLDYPTGNLGEWVVQQEKIEAKKAEITDGDAYTIEVVDQTKEQLILDVDSDCDSSDPHHILSTDYEKLATVKVEVENWGDFGDMSIDQFAIDGTAEYVVPNSFQGSTNTCADFDNVCGDADGDFNFQTCSITGGTEFTNGGVQQSVEILGSGFGDTLVGAKIFIPEANEGGLDWKEIDATDKRFVQSWKDDKLVINVLDVMEGSVFEDSPAGSGYWRIKPFDGDLICETLIEVGYSLDADVLEVSQDSFREERYIYPITGLQEIQDYPVTGSLEVYVDSFSLAANNIDTTLFNNLIKEVICKWEQNSIIEINYNGIGQAPEQTEFDFKRPNDTINPSTFMTISYAETGGKLAVTEFIAQTGINRCGDETLSFILDRDIMISSTDNFYLGLGGTNEMGTGQYDLQSVLLHEFGHALGHSHANDIDTTNRDFDTRVMYTNSPPPQFQRNVLDAHASSGAVEFWRHTNSEADPATSTCTSSSDDFMLGVIDIDPDKATCSTNSIRQLGNTSNKPCFKVSVINKIAHFSEFNPDADDLNIKSINIYNTLGQEIFASSMHKGSRAVDMSDVNHTGIVILSLTDYSGAVCSIQVVL